jgi:hypothetical protein
MGVLPPLQVTVDVRGWSAILDVRLALHRQGLLLATRLAEELRVFLVPTLWEVLDNTAYFDRHPERLAEASPEMSDEITESSLALSQWERARLELGLSSLRIYWAGDTQHESSLPKDMDAGLSDRFGQLAEGLTRRLGMDLSELDAGWPLHEGSRDAAALAAAMTRYRPVILTLAESDGEAPALCNLLSASGIPCHQVSSAESQPVLDYLSPILARSAVLELAWDGLQLAMVHLVTPLALLMPTAIEGEDKLFQPLSEPPPDPWSQASAYWYTLP